MTSPSSLTNGAINHRKGEGKRKSIRTQRFEVDNYCDNEEQAMLQQALKVCT